MKRNLLLSMVCAFTLCTSSLFAQTATRLAFWDFEGKDGDPYAYYMDDEWGTIRAWVVPNEYTGKNVNAKFSAYREGTIGGEYMGYYLGMTRATTTILGASCLAAQNWDNVEMRTLRYWYLENISTEGMKDVKVTLYLTCAGTGGPGKFKFGYKIGDGPWVDDANFKDARGNVTVSGNFVGSDPADLWVHNLPAACNNQAKVSFRWLSNDLRADGVTAIAATSYSRLDNVEVNAVSTGASIPKVKSEQLVFAEGSQLISRTNANVTVFNLAGVTVYTGSLLKGKSIGLSKGIYIVKAASNTQAETVKILVK